VVVVCTYRQLSLLNHQPTRLYECFSPVHYFCLPFVVSAAIQSFMHVLKRADFAPHAAPSRRPQLSHHLDTSGYIAMRGVRATHPALEAGSASPVQANDSTLPFMHAQHGGIVCRTR
jgi:hypothetical protein